MDKDKNYLSQAKKAELENELKNLKTVVRKEVAEQLEFAKSLGDLSENAEYHEARDRQVDIEDRITQLEELLKDSVVIDTHHSTSVEVGSTVIIKKEGGDKSEFTVVGSEEADVAQGRISYQSPIGQALLGKKEGDKVKVGTPRGEINYSIIKIK